MKSWHLIVFLTLLFLSILVCAPLDAQDNKLKIIVGESFPNLVLPDMYGEPASIADFRGKKTILHVFASW